MDSDHGGNTAGSGYLITAPVPFFATYIAGIGVSTAWALIAAGEIETIAVGRRRLVVIESWRNYVARKLAAPPEDARRNNRVRPSARLRSKPIPAGEAAPVTRPESAWVANRLAPSALSGREETAGPAQSVRRTALKVSWLGARLVGPVPHTPEGRPRSRLGADRLGRGSGPDGRGDAPRR